LNDGKANGCLIGFLNFCLRDVLCFQLVLHISRQKINKYRLQLGNLFFTRNCFVYLTRPALKGFQGSEEASSPPALEKRMFAFLTLDP
jgi:hypothetical protein